MKNCRTLSGLLKCIASGESAQLTVYVSQHQPLPGAWGVSEGTVILNLGKGRYARCSESTYEKIQKYLFLVTV